MLHQIQAFLTGDGQQLRIEQMLFTNLYFINGSAMCALDSASETLSVRSRIECSSQCLQQGPGCKHVNFKYNNNAPKCDICLFTPTRYGLTPNCIHLVVKETS